MANGARTKTVIETIRPWTGKERVLVWERAKGLWKNRKPDPIKELNKMRQEWERKLPRLE